MTNKLQADADDLFVKTNNLVDHKGNFDSHEMIKVMADALQAAFNSGAEKMRESAAAERYNDGDLIADVIRYLPRPEYGEK